MWVSKNPTLTDESLSIFYDQIYRPLYLGKINTENIKSIFESPFKRKYNL